jgi:hypothetical protein
MCKGKGKCPNCWTEKDTKDLWFDKLINNKRLYKLNKIDYETYIYNMLKINKYDK